MLGSALYFPHIDIHDPAWLRSAILFWNEIQTIAPTAVNAGVKPHQTPEQKCATWPILAGAIVRHFVGCRFVHRPAWRSAPK